MLVLQFHQLQIRIRFPVPSMPNGSSLAMRAALILALATTLVVPVVGPAQTGWESLGPYGGGIVALAIDQRAPGTLYAATSYGRVFKSSDGGGQWRLIRPVEGFNTWPVTLAVDPTTSGTVYVGSRLSPWLSKSVDGGATWSLVGSRQELHFQALVFDPKTPGVVYAVTERLGPLRSYALLKSTDGGVTWLTLNVDIGGPGLVIDPQTPTTLFAAAPGDILRSKDGGNTWQALNARFNGSVVALAIDPKTPTTIYAVTTRANRVYKSSDGGSTWKDLAYLKDIQVSTFAVDPQTPTTLYASALRRTQGTSTSLGGVLKSIDGGATWRMASFGLTSHLVTSVVLDPRVPSTVYAGTISSGIFKSMDGAGTWHAVNTGLSEVYTTALAVDPRNPKTIYAGTRAGGFKSIDGGKTWQALRIVPEERCLVYFYISLPLECGASVSTVDIDSKTPTTVYIGTSDDGLYKSTDGGITWHPVDLGGSAYPSGIRPLRISVLAIDPRNSANIYVSAQPTGIPIPEYAPRPQGIGVFKTTDGGVNWRKVGARISIGVNALVFAPADPTTLYAGTFGGVFKSTDGGENWQASSTGWTDRSVLKLIIDQRIPTTFYATTDNSIFKSADGGANWRAIASFGARALVLDPHSAATIYCVTTSGGVFKSTDGGTSWNPMNVGLAATITSVGTIVNGSPVRTSPTVHTTWLMVWALAIDPKTPGIVYAGTAGGGVFALRQ